MKETARIRKLLEALVDYENDNGYYDDDKGIEVIDGSEEECYESIMKDDELHFLTEKKVRGFIHMMFNDSATFSGICMEFRAF